MLCGIGLFFMKECPIIGQKEPSVRFHYCWCLRNHEGFY